MASSAVLPAPPKGYKLNVSPPAGYKINDSPPMPDYSDVPAFIQQGVDMSKVRQAPTPVYAADGPNSMATVDLAEPYKINVDMPDLYGPPVLNHELTHTFQGTRNPDLPAPKMPSGSVRPEDYTYGGVAGLEAARKQGKTVADFNVEQQGDIVRDYKSTQDQYLAKARAGKITDADKKTLYRAHEAYHPIVSQLAAMPGKEVNLKPTLLDLALGRLPTLDAKPEAPGLPDYSVKGMSVLPADPLLGGKSVSVPTPSQKPRKKDTTPVKSN